MNATMRSEVIKFTSVRSSAWIALIAAAIAALAGTVLVAPISEGVWAPLRGHPFLWTYMTIIGLIGYTIGARAFTDEARYRTVVWTALAQPRRGRAVAAKGAVSAITGAAMTAVAVAATSVVVLLMRPAELTVTAGDLLSLGGLLVGAGALWALIGLGVALVVQNQAAVLVGGFGWFVLGEGLIGGQIGKAEWFLPGHAAGAILGVSGLDMPSQAEGAALFAAYALVVLMVGALVHRRRDIA